MQNDNLQGDSRAKTQVLPFFNFYGPPVSISSTLDPRQFAKLGGRRTMPVWIEHEDGNDNE